MLHATYRVTRRDSTVPETTFTFRLDEDLKNAFAQAAKAQERTSAQLLRTLMRDLVEQAIAKREYDEWFVKEVDEAVAKKKQEILTQ